MPPTTAPPTTSRRKRVFSSVLPPASLDDFPLAAKSHTLGPNPPLFSRSSHRSHHHPEPDSQRPENPTFRTSTTSQQTEIATSDDDDNDELWPEQAIWDRAWRVATKFLAVPNQGFPTLLRCDQMDQSHFMRLWNRHRTADQETLEAFACLLEPFLGHRRVRHNGDALQKSILDWYGFEIRRHFLRNVRSGLVEMLKGPEKEGLLQRIVVCLQVIRGIYFEPLAEILTALYRGEQEGVYGKLCRSFHMMVAYALPWTQASALLSREVMKESLVILGIDALRERAAADGLDHVDDMDVDRQCSMSYQDWRDEPSPSARMQMLTEQDSQVGAARERLLLLFNGLQLVGMGGDKAQKVFASVMDALMTEFVRTAYTGQWEGPSLASQHLRQWIENVFAQLVVQVLSIINVPESGEKEVDNLDVTLGDVEKWQEIGIARLGALRTSELFDVIVEWPASSGAIEDLRHFTTYPAARYHLTQSFITALNLRLLHPGASTIEILQVYISIIRAFNLLDPKGVLLDRIARPIRRYLRDRDDTIKVIVGGLLADPADADGQTASLHHPDTLVELSAELTKAHQNSLRADSGELDWDDMNWMPDPVDAAPDYRKSKTSDVIGSLISLFDSKEMFVKEMQNMLGERLLQKRADFDQEMSVLELLKVRFGDNALQACEVMLRDIFDSRRVDGVIRNDQGLAKSPQQPENPDLHAKILSHFFWPDLPGPEFRVPEPIASLQQRYAQGFGSLKQSRKLTWLNGLGQVTVELDLEDRVFVDDVTTWQATVIYAFNSSSAETTTKTITGLAHQLQMPATLVRSACLFWVSKRILHEHPRDTFRVLEVLPSSSGEHDGGPPAAQSTATSPKTNTAPTTPTTHHPRRPSNLSTSPVFEDAAEAAAAAAAAAAKESAEAAAMEKMNLYWQFIVGMLTNQGAMPLQRIVMMLKIAVPGGFPFSNEELREFLAGMVAKGNLEIVSGGNYKIKAQ
ncbi:anaphase promoting complex subunit 2 [Aspergillus aculeatinus CBS 121060]|uniref:Anaphase-promoting complex subunit ApcB n=1 Tax=Aspergillus aculeatinus CBS 121060 TaxID=1448322 RepID=A0ACD1H0M5_9EURO|nr:anaphase-promoting complex subunit ApcB [Aspergillus aculeatinus CBS 121060]RAH67155.1 anaphase-promoting complex subunit ApcB [Aspergillus aculeatinus CBS 121060]